VHTKASSSPAPNQGKNAKGTSKSKSKKAARAAKVEQAEEESGEEEDEVVRCICGNNNQNDPRAFIGCDACSVWQHNVCMGITVHKEDIPEHYFCEECRPEEHRETLAALAEGQKIWEERTALYEEWSALEEKRKKMSAARRKSKGKEDAPMPWLKKDIPDELPSGPEPELEPDIQPEAQPESRSDVEPAAAAPESESQETGTKRKRESVKPEPEEQQVQPEVAEKSTPAARPDKRRKSSQAVNKGALDVDTALVDIDQLPADRKKVGQALSKTIAEDIQERAKAGYRIPDGHTAKSLGERHAARIEYALFMNYGEASSEKYKSQFRSLLANFKRNKLLIERLLNKSLMAEDLATMESKDMASEELQRERAKMKEELDRQAVAIEEEGPKIRRTHKGDEIIEDESYRATESSSYSAPVRERTSIGEGEETPVNGQGPAGSPPQGSQAPPAVDTKRPSDVGMERRQSSQQFDMQNIWAKTAQSPTTAAQPRPMQMPPRRRSSVQHAEGQADGAKDDPDVDRMLQDDEDDDYSPIDFTNDASVVWRGRLVHTGEGEPVVNARFVAGRDLAASTAPWREILSERMSIDGRLQIGKAEEYLCGLQWSHSSDVSVLALTPYDDADAFKAVFNYFQSRGRYAVVNKDKPQMVKDLYIIPVEAGATSLPEHVEKLEHCTVKLPVEERLLLATFVVHRAPENPGVAEESTPARQQPAGANGQHNLPPHMRPGAQGPAGSPLNTNNPTFSPNPQHTMPAVGYGAPATPSGQGTFPPNPYSNAPPPDQQSAFPPQAQGAPPQPHPNPLVAEILGPHQHATTAMQVVYAEPNIGREKLENLRKILDEDIAARTNLEALAHKLMGPN